MAVTVAIVATSTPSVKPSQEGVSFVTATVTFDSSYPTGGEAVAASDFGLSSIRGLIVGSNDEAGVSARWDASASKLKLFDEENTSGIEAEFANTGDASANVVTLLAIGRPA